MDNLIFVKNMVCNRCIEAVSRIFSDLGLNTRSVALGEVELEDDSVPSDMLARLDEALVKAGFERLDNSKNRWVEKAKNLIIEQIHHSPNVDQKQNWSDFIAAKIPIEYTYFSSQFAAEEGLSLEQYIIRQKIERVKELLHYGELSLSEIADVLGYSSVAHLSAQFKKVCGITPSAYKKQKPGRKPLDAV